MITSQQAVQVIADHVAASYQLILHLGRLSSRYSHETVRAYQAQYNARLSDIQQAVTLDMRGDTRLANTLRELAPDGVWGTQTAAAASLWIAGGSVPLVPGRASDVPGWLTVNRTTLERVYLTKLDQAGQARVIATRASTPIDTTGETITQQASSTQQAQQVMRDTAAVSAGSSSTSAVMSARETELDPFMIEGQRAGVKPDSMVPWIVAGVTILAIGGVIGYASYKKRGRGRK